MNESDADARASRATVADVRRLSAEALSYLGDAVYECHVRRSMVLPPSRLQDYRGAVVGRVRATCQAQVMAVVQPHLSDEELAVALRGRNRCGRGPRHLAPELYRQASGLEAVIGYLHLLDPERLVEVLALCDAVPCDSNVAGDR